jgi:hypothetical protein
MPQIMAFALDTLLKGVHVKIAQVARSRWGMFCNGKKVAFRSLLSEV